jgi:hypothetical protein
VSDDLRPAYEAWLRKTFGPAQAKAGLLPKPSDTLDIEQMRGDLVIAVGWRGRDPKVVAAAVKLADKWRDLPQSVRGEILWIAVDANPALFDKIKAEVATETDRSKRQEMLRALAGVRDTKRQSAALELVLDPKLDPRETIQMLGGGGFGAAGGREANLAVMQQFFRDHQDAIQKAMPQGGTASGFTRLSALFTETCDAAKRDEVVEYVNKTFAALPGGKRTVAQNVEQMDQCIERKKQLEPEVRAWLSGAKTKPAK